MEENTKTLLEEKSPLEMLAESNTEGSLLGESTSMVSDVLEVTAPAENSEDAAAERESARKEWLKIPENQAEVIYQNYIKTHILSGQEKRRIRREILKDAKKGKYARLFDEDAAQKRDSVKFQNLNSPS